ncbi:MAG: hypothetical protein SF069_11140 [Phycisphaerae bacterium]|nr:hypothetical protein [Phycisphaerae bacterium]
MNQPQSEWGIREQVNFAGNVILLTARTFALPAELFLRKDFGQDYLGLRGVLVPVAMILWAGLWPEHDPRPLIGFIWFFFLMCLVERIRGIWRRSHGDVCHSRYDGTPGLQRFWPKRDEVWVKQKVEPWFTMAIGGLLMQWNVPLGSFVFTSGWGMLLSMASDVIWRHRRAQEMYDAHVEQQVIFGEFRRMRGDDSGADGPSLVEFPDNTKSKQRSRR